MLAPDLSPGPSPARGGKGRGKGKRRHHQGLMLALVLASLPFWGQPREPKARSALGERTVAYPPSAFARCSAASASAVRPSARRHRSPYYSSQSRCWN